MLRIHVDFGVAPRRIGYTFLALLRVGSSMVEQRPFKALVVGSSPTQPNPSFRLGGSLDSAFEAAYRPVYKLSPSEDKSAKIGVFGRDFEIH